MARVQFARCSRETYDNLPDKDADTVYFVITDNAGLYLGDTHISDVGGTSLIAGTGLKIEDGVISLDVQRAEDEYL